MQNMKDLEDSFKKKQLENMENKLEKKKEKNIQFKEK